MQHDVFGNAQHGVEWRQHDEQTPNDGMLLWMAQRNVQFKKSLKLMHILVRLVNSVEVTDECSIVNSLLGWASHGLSVMCADDFSNDVYCNGVVGGHVQSHQSSQVNDGFSLPLITTAAKMEDVDWISSSVGDSLTCVYGFTGWVWSMVYYAARLGSVLQPVSVYVLV